MGAITPKTWLGFCRALDRMGLLDDPDYTELADRRLHRDRLIASIEESTRLRTTADLVESWTAEGVPCAPLATYDEVFNDDHLDARGFYWDAPHPTAGVVRQIGSPMRFSNAESARGAAGPSLGQHTRSVLAGIGMSAEQIDALVGEVTVRA